MRRFAILLLLLLAALPAAAQTKATAAPDAAVPKIDFEHYTLPNGLDVILHVDRKLPIVHVNQWYHVGSKNERVGRTGFAHLFEHMMFQGSKNASGEYFTYVEKAGANLREGGVNGTTNNDRTNYFVTAPAGSLEFLLWLESDRLATLADALDQKKLDNQIEVVRNERRQGLENQPYGRAFKLISENLHPSGHPYSWSVIGSHEDLTAASLEDVQNFFRTYYTPNNLTLVVAGDFDKEKAKELIAKYFGPIPAGPEVPRFTTPPPPIGGEKRDVIEGAVQLPRVYRMYHVPAFGTREWIAADLLNSVLANGKASRLERSLVYDQQIAQDAVGFTWDAEAGGMMIMWATAKPGVPIERVEAALDAELQKIAASGVTAEELARAKTAAEASIANQLSEFASRADLINQVTTMFGDPKLVNQIIPRYQQITAQELQAIASKYLVPDNRVTVTFVPQQKTASAPASGDMEGGQR